MTSETESPYIYITTSNGGINME